MTNQAAAVVWAADYLPFGQADVTVSTVENNLRFAGQYFDSETRLHYNWNRYYDPKIGRYLRADPIGFEGGISLFTYAQNNPIILSDANGLAAAPGYWQRPGQGLLEGDGFFGMGGAVGAGAGIGLGSAMSKRLTEIIEKAESPPKYECQEPDPCITACIRCVKGKWHEKVPSCIFCFGCILFGGV